MRTSILALAVLSCSSPPAFAQLIGHPDAPIRIGHYHLNVTSVEAHKKFWAGTLGGKAIKFGGIDVIEFPDAFIFLRLRKPDGPTRGTAFDHIGFEIKNLEAFTKKLEAQGIKLDRPYTKVPQLGIAIAFIKDPWGTNIEMTEGLADIK